MSFMENIKKLKAFLIKILLLLYKSDEQTVLLHIFESENKVKNLPYISVFAKVGC